MGLAVVGMVGHVLAVELVPRPGDPVTRWQASPGVGLARQPEAPTTTEAGATASVPALVVQSPGGAE